jgi:hypothetical protein
MKKLLFLFALLIVASITYAQTVVYHENFDLPGNADSVTASGALSNFAINSRLFVSGTHSDSTLVSPNDTAFLTTNSFSTVGYSYVFLNFSHICKIELLDAGEVQISINNGAWTNLTGAQYINPGNSQFVTNGNKFSSNTYPLDWAPTQNAIKPTQTWWKNEQFNISALAGNQANVRIRFSLRDANGNGANFADGWFIDNITVSASISELTPPHITMKAPIIQDTVFNTGPWDIYAYITDASGIDTAYIDYQVFSGPHLYIPMALISDSTYKGTIPSYTYNNQINYHVHAVDNSSAHNAADGTNQWFYIKKGPNIVQIGNGTGTQTWPFYNNWGYARSASIYLSNEINISGVINSLQWYVSTVSATNDPVKIYLKSTTATTFTADTWANLIAGATLVYNGTVNFPTVGWQTFTPTATFNYASGNLMVLCETNYGGGGTSPYPYFQYTPTTGNTHQDFYQDNSAPTGTGYTNTYRPNIKIGFPALNLHADAGVKQILTPTGTIISGVNSPVTLYIKNYAIDTLKKVTVAWNVDGVLQTPYYWTGNLPEAITSTVLNIGNVNVGPGAHTIKAWTEMPNDSLDLNHSNDTSSISFYACASLLSGTYTVGGVGADFPAFSDVMTALNNCGVGGPTVFLINSGTYNNQLTFGAINGVSATNTITFKPNTGATVVIRDSSATSTIKFNGTGYITFDGSNNGTTSRDMSILNRSTAASTAAIWMASAGASQGCVHDVIKNCIIKGGANTSGIYGVIIGGSTIGATGADNDYITLQNNSISKAYVGIWAEGSAATNPGLMDNLQITGNSIGSSVTTDYLGHDGIYLQNATGADVEKNTVFNIITTNTTPVGITLYTGVVSTTVARNNINNISYTSTGGYGGRGLYVSTGSAASNLIIANNVIYNIGGDGYTSFSNSSPVGMFFDGTIGGLSIYYNSVYMSGNLTYSAATLSAAILFNSTSITGINLKNNVFQNSMNNTASATAKNYAIYSTAPATSFAGIDYNDYYASGTQGVLGYLGAAQATIAAWRTATTQDVHSISTNPNFLSTSDLHTFSPDLNDHATPIAGITTDNEDHVRDATTPDIGAYEYDIPAKNIGIISILQPVSSCSLTASENVVIRVKNYGGLNIDTAQVYYRINNGTPVHEQMIHTIMPDSSYNYTFATTADLSVPGNYVIKSYVHLNGDTTAINDTINNYNISAGYNLNLAPYTMGFESTDDMSLWTKADVNADSYTWTFPYAGNSHSGSNSAQVYNGSTTGNDWLFSRCFKLNAGSTYKIDFWYKAAYSTSAQNLDLKVGTSNTPAAMTTTLLTLASFVNASYLKATVTYTPSVSGSYNFGWFSHSTTTYAYTYIDDINISLVPLQEAALIDITAPV